MKNLYFVSFKMLRVNYIVLRKELYKFICVKIKQCLGI